MYDLVKDDSLIQAQLIYDLVEILFKKIGASSTIIVLFPDSNTSLPNFTFKAQGL